MDRAQDRHAELRNRLGHHPLLAPAHRRGHAADDGPARHGAQRVAGVDRPRQVLRRRPLDADDIDALGLQRRHQAGVLRVDELEVGRLARLPVPAAGGIDQRLGALVPAVGSHPLELIARSAHEHLAQRADLVVGTPLAAPYQRLLLGGLERRLGLGGTQRDPEPDRIGVVVHAG